MLQEVDMGTGAVATTMVATAMSPPMPKTTTVSLSAVCLDNNLLICFLPPLKHSTSFVRVNLHTLNNRAPSLPHLFRIDLSVNNFFTFHTIPSICSVVEILIMSRFNPQTPCRPVTPTPRNPQEGSSNPKRKAARRCGSSSVSLSPC